VGRAGEPDERLLDEVLRRRAVVDEQPGQRGEPGPLDTEQVGLQRVRRPVRALDALHRAGVLEALRTSSR